MKAAHWKGGDIMTDIEPVSGDRPPSTVGLRQPSQQPKAPLKFSKALKS